MEENSNQNKVGKGGESSDKTKQNSKQNVKRKSTKPARIAAAINYKNLDEWLENSVKGIRLEPVSNGSSCSGPFNFNTHFEQGFGMAGKRPEAWQFPPELNYLNLPLPGMGHLPYHHLHIPTYSNSNNNEFASLPPTFSTSAIGGGIGTNALSNIEENAAKAVDSNSSQVYAAGDQMLNTSSVGNSDNDNDESGDSKSTSISKSSLKLDEPPSLSGLANDPSLLHPGTSMSDSNKLLSNLIKQIQLLHETNSKLYQKLHETKVEVDALKVAPHNHWSGVRQRRDSISGLSMHSQPPLGVGSIGGGVMGLNGHGYGAQSPAPTYHSQGYTPGVVTDVIREVREGTRVREEALLNRVKGMIEERQWSINESNLRVVRELEELKIQMHQMQLDKKHTDDKLLRVENELAALRNIITHSMAYPRHSFSDFGGLTPASPSFDNRTAINPVLRRPTIAQRLSFGAISESAVGDKNGNKSNQRGGGYGICASSEEAESDTMQLERDTLELRRELQDAIASKKASESKIAQLERLVTTLKHQIVPPPPPDYSLTMHEEEIGIKPASPQMSQKASQVQTVTPKSILSNSVSLNGPVTDL